MTNAGVAQLTRLGGEASPELLVDVMSNGTMATLITLAMTFGLVVPKMPI
jgi:hypothetical protein